MSIEEQGLSLTKEELELIAARREEKRKEEEAERAREETRKKEAEAKQAKARAVAEALHAKAENVISTVYNQVTSLNKTVSICEKEDTRRLNRYGDLGWWFEMKKDHHIARVYVTFGEHPGGGEYHLVTPLLHRPLRGDGAKNLLGQGRKRRQVPAIQRG